MGMPTIQQWLMLGSSSAAVVVAMADAMVDAIADAMVDAMADAMVDDCLLYTSPSPRD